MPATGRPAKSRRSTAEALTTIILALTRAGLRAYRQRHVAVRDRNRRGFSLVQLLTG
jgi:hypothetical protein